jgi:hypothetical protein
MTTAPWPGADLQVLPSSRPEVGTIADRLIDTTAALNRCWKSWKPRRRLLAEFSAHAFREQTNT